MCGLTLDERVVELDAPRPFRSRRPSGIDDRIGMTLRLGAIAGFKWDVAVLLAGTPGNIEQLADQLAQLDTSDGAELHVHAMASVSARWPARLVAARDGRPEPSDRGGSCRWLLRESDLDATVVKLRSLARACEGHQYFELSDGREMMVSIGEYDDQWWAELDAGR